MYQGFPHPLCLGCEPSATLWCKEVKARQPCLASPDCGAVSQVHTFLA